MVGLYRCPRCGSAGSIEFDMCQVCLYELGDTVEAEVLTGTLVGSADGFTEGSVRERAESSERRALANV